MIKFTLIDSKLKQCIIIWATPFENVTSGICGQRRPRSACASAQSDQSLRCPQTESFDAIDVSVEKMKSGWDFTHEQEDVNPHTLRMLEGTFSLDTTHLVVVMWPVINTFCKKEHAISYPVSFKA